MIAGRGALFRCVSVCFFLLGPPERTARAAAFTVALQYAAGSGCPDLADFKGVVIARLGHDPFDERGPYHVLVRIAPGDGGLDGHIEWRDPRGKWAGEQSFPPVSTDCVRLVRAMGFALAVQIQLLANTRPDSPPAIPVPLETGPPSEASPLPTPILTNPAESTTAPAVMAPAPAPTPIVRPVFAIGAGPSLALGMSSTPIMLGRIFAALLWHHVSVELATEASLPATTRRLDGAGFSQQHLLVSTAACAGVTRWSGCLLVKAGQVRMAGEDIDRPVSAALPVLETGARVAIIQRFGYRVFLNAHLDGLINVTRWTGSLDQIPVWTAPRFAAALGVDAGIRFF